jgi:hypothetical protein
MAEAKKQAHWPKKQFIDAIFTISKSSILPASVCLFMQTELDLGIQWWKQKNKHIGLRNSSLMLFLPSQNPLSFLHQSASLCKQDWD